MLAERSGIGACSEKRKQLFSRWGLLRDRDKVGTLLIWMSGCVFFSKFLVYWLWKGKIAFRLERPINTPIRESLRLTRQTREGEEICIRREWIYHSKGPLGPDHFPNDSHRKCRVTLHAWEYGRQWWASVHLELKCSLSHRLACIASTYINELYLTLSIQSLLYLVKRIYFKTAKLHACLYTGIFLYAILWVTIIIEMEVTTDESGISTHKYQWMLFSGSTSLSQSIAVIKASSSLFYFIPFPYMWLYISFIFFVLENISGKTHDEKKKIGGTADNDSNSNYISKVSSSCTFQLCVC